MAASDQQCINHADEGHEPEAVLRDVVSNTLGARINVCVNCIKANSRYVKCGLCNRWNIGKTLQMKSPFVFVKCKDADESFCYECVGVQLPSRLCSDYKSHEEEMKQVFAPYYAIRKIDKADRIDFSSPDTIRLVDPWGKVHAPNTPGKMGHFGHAFYQIAKEIPEFHEWLEFDFIKELQEELFNKRSSVQAMRYLCEEKGKGMIRRLIPTAKTEEEALSLIPPSAIRSCSPHVAREMRAVNTLGDFLEFLRRYQ